MKLLKVYIAVQLDCSTKLFSSGVTQSLHASVSCPSPLLLCLGGALECSQWP